MHTNHRRKNIYTHARPRYGHALGWYKREYWTWHRANQRELLAHEAFDDLQDRHPKTCLWDAT